MKTSANLRINGTRLWQSLEDLEDMARVGPGVRGGCNRQALTDEDKQGRDLFLSWCEAEGMSVSVDTMGNMFATLTGSEPELDAVAIGSHLDTQPTGGRYDGLLGVLAGLEVVRALRERGIRTRRSITLVNWTNEEGTRFPPAMVSSGVFAGVHTQEWAYQIKDSRGITFGAELERIGYMGTESVGQRRFHAMFEYYIEQGPILEAGNRDIGVVTHGQGLRWIEVALTGKEAHTGSTPMNMRANAGLGMAQITSTVHQVAMDHQPDAVGAVGHVEIFPNSRNVIPGQCIFTIDIRLPDQATLDAMTARIEDEAGAIAATLGLTIEMETVGYFAPVTFDPDCVNLVRSVTEELGLSHQDIISGVGHDACWVNRVPPTTMIMYPCVDGLSHNEDERITLEWAAAGNDVLLHSVIRMAEVSHQGHAAELKQE
ncbi:Zn-dependent hydrolase [Paracoccus sp. 11-3]|uniref:Zn-dependent hydrolase n=2 Tax=Paracoccus amoyensis TaxID=2760093 RepID=A0A926JER3_9RHOB|nr:Zn-dependent hydrolase [Paracoccus amoyensis]